MNLSPQHSPTHSLYHKFFASQPLQNPPKIKHQIQTPNFIYVCMYVCTKICRRICEPNREAASSRPIKRTSLRSYKLKKLQEEEDSEIKETNLLKTQENTERERERITWSTRGRGTFACGCRCGGEMRCRDQ